MSTDLEARRRTEGLVALLVVQVFFGLFPLFVKFAVAEGGFSPRLIVAWRLVFGALVLGLAAWLRHRRNFIPPRADWGRLALCALFGVILNQLFALEGMARTSVTSTGLLMTLIPVFTYTIAIAIKQEGFRSTRAVGILIALVGAAWLVVGGRAASPGGDASLLGNLFIIVNCLSYSVYLVLARRLLDRHPPELVIAWVFGLALLVTPLVVWNEPLVPPAPSTGVWLAVAYILVCPTALAYFLNTFALARVSASTVAVFIYLQPLIAGLAGALVRDERPGLHTFIAAGLLFVGLRFVTRREVPALVPTRG